MNKYKSYKITNTTTN